MVYFNPEKLLESRASGRKTLSAVRNRATQPKIILFPARCRGEQAFLKPGMTPGFRARHGPVGLHAAVKALTWMPYIAGKEVI